MQNIEGFLEKIYPKIQKQLAEAQKEISLEEIKKLASERKLPLVDLKERILKRKCPVGVIAEIKRASPSLGMISDRNILSQVQAYIDGGAVAISVLTEPSYFNGSIDDLTDLKTAFPYTPFLRKDFIITEYQVYESKAIGADMALLITRWLEESELKKLYGLIRTLGMHALVEVEDEDDFKRALSVGAEIIGINARNLIDLSVDVSRVTVLAQLMHSSVGANSVRPILVGESGVDNPEIIRQWHEAGIDVVLVGGALMKSEDPKRMVEAFSLRN